MEFRFYYFTSRYAESVAFYRDVLGLDVFRSWDREGDRGTIFRSPNGTGYIEVEEGATLPANAGGLYIQVEDLDDLHARALAAGATVVKPLGVTTYGHRNFKVVDPSGIEVAFFEYASKS
jgi:predicted enzyme related to lactoylglutathione lyase